MIIRIWFVLSLCTAAWGEGVLFQCRTNGASVVYLAGDFNDWARNQAGKITDPAAAMNVSNGVWRKIVKLEAGTYRFKFNVNGEPTGWFAPDVERDADGNAILRVYPNGSVEVRSPRDYRTQLTKRGVLFQYYATDAHLVYLAGNFNDWGKNRDGLVFDPQYAMSLSSGVWSATMVLEPGRHAYQFVVDGDRWVADPNASDKDGEGHSIVEVK